MSPIDDAGRFNQEPQVQIALVHALGADRPWGARAGFGWLASAGDGPVWPLGGGVIRVDWHGRDRVGVEVLAELGLADLLPAQSGFFPLTAGLVLVGGRVSTGGPPSAVGGLQLQRAAAVDRLPDPSSTSWLGWPFLAVTGEASVALGVGAPRATLAGGLQGSFLALTDL